MLNTPVDVAQAPIEITHFGSGICMYNWRITGAILFETRPAMIIRSDCRGDPRKTSAPNRAMSNREALMAIISIAQQARPKVIGQMEFLRAQLIALSSVVSSTLSPKSCPDLVVDTRKQVGGLAQMQLVIQLFALQLLFVHDDYLDYPILSCNPQRYCSEA